MDIPVNTYTPAFVIVGATIVAWLSFQLVAIYTQYRKLQHIEGLFIAAISPSWLFHHTLRGDNYLAIQAGLRKYGSPLRIAPNQIATDDPQIDRAMNTSKSSFTKGHWFKGTKFDPRVDNILSMINEDDHIAMRNKLIPGVRLYTIVDFAVTGQLQYTGKEVPTLEQDVDQYTVEFIDFIRAYTDQSQSFDLARAVNFFTTDILTKIAFGEALGFLHKNEDVFNYLQSSQDFYPIMELGSNDLIVFNFLKSPLMAGAQPKPTDRFGFGAIVGHTQKIVAECFAADADARKDMLGSFVRHGLKQEECESESLLQILAGSDSTATALRSAFCFILTSPPVYSKLLREIQATVETGGASRPVIKNSEAQALPYLQAVVKEGLRMFMPLQGLGGRVPPKGGLTINDIFIPEGTEVSVAKYARLRREDLFGHDANTFRPERWIDNNPVTIQRMANDQELIFGYGRSSCLCKNITLMELGKAIFETLNAFDLTLVNNFRPMSVRSNSVVIQKDFIVRAYPRLSA